MIMYLQSPDLLLILITWHGLMVEMYFKSHLKWESVRGAAELHGSDCKGGMQEHDLTMNGLSLAILVTLLVTAELWASLVGWSTLQLYRSFSVPGVFVCLSGNSRGISCKSLFLTQLRGVRWAKKKCLHNLDMSM